MQQRMCRCFSCTSINPIITHNGKMLAQTQNTTTVGAMLRVAPTLDNLVPVRQCKTRAAANTAPGIVADQTLTRLQHSLSESLPHSSIVELTRDNGLLQGNRPGHSSTRSSACCGWKEGMSCNTSTASK